ncbi:MAG: glycerophosphodiester phosphodiesterase family protein, partial [Chloroflexota bacterium]
MIGPNPESVIRTAGGRTVLLKVHRAQWSGAYPENSLPAIEECYREAVARAEIDLHMLRDADFLVHHDPTLDDSTTGTGSVGDLTRNEARSVRLRFKGGVSPERPPLFSEVAALIREQQYPTLLELDLPAFQPLPWARVEELARLVEPVKDRVMFNGPDWNLRRLLRVDSTLPMSYDPGPYLDWVPEGDAEEKELGLPRGAYGYLDAHPLART